MAYEVQGGAECYAVYDGKERVSRIYASREAAEMGLDRMKRPKVEPVARTCLCCGTPFTAQGRFLRLCPKCRSAA